MQMDEAMYLGLLQLASPKNEIFFLKTSVKTDKYVHKYHFAHQLIENEALNYQTFSSWSNLNHFMQQLSKISSNRYLDRNFDK